MRLRVFVVLMVLGSMIAAMLPVSVARAQLPDDIRDRVSRAAVRIVVVPLVNGVPSVENGVMTGSGTIITPSGLILTNHHVIEEAIRDRIPVAVFLSDGRSQTTAAFFAEVVQIDSKIDLAILQIVADSDAVPVDVNQLHLPAVSVGDSNSLSLGDALFIVGYPGAGMGGLTFTEGVVSGFRAEPGISGDAWILTDAAASVGNSGGTAVDRNGVLVGIPTMSPYLPCDRVDTNFDGMVDERDSCGVAGVPVAFLRPSNLAQPLISVATGDGSDSTVASQPLPRTESVEVAGTNAGPSVSGDATTAASAGPATSVLPPLAPLVISSLVPTSLALSPGQSFQVLSGGPESLAEVTSKFENPAMAQQMLTSLGWQEGSYRVFTVDNPPPNAVGWLELHVHRFATVDGAHEGLPLLAWERQRLTGMRPVPMELFADQSIALAGPAYNGNELTIFARRGNLVIRATGIAPNGDPASDVIEAILIPLVPLAEDTRVVSPVLIELLPGPEHVSTALTLTEERARSASNTAETFADWDEASTLFQRWGWRESASRVYTATGGATANGTTRFEAVVYRWQDPTAASVALSYFVATRADALSLDEVSAPNVGDEARAISGPVTEGVEATVYVRFESVLLRFTAIGRGDPMADLLALLNVP
jgi:S1-C subfamily serine protease